ncbi:hypothetical protein KR51_00032970 [Rubidibacter lacunae KORDI 51-2]|uniref:Glycosyltransferase n=1 Tax=Rubidibacter lacunae KORDI 51-2 TaxID=582515 RepID=U5D6Q8_9CHRO|nr:hypothetical protein [Rubidibacter lacunae]ERN40348.1 hypothetical protein KR51_00032970 [Rubidibacter lacunae KORDI 51-2]
MKISLGVKLRRGPWGGGNQFAQSLANYLEQRGNQVSFDLSAPDLDLILLMDPRDRGNSAAYRDGDVVRYLRRNPGALVIHRINECDERKGTKGVNQRLEHANLSADYTVFVASWLRELYANQNRINRESIVILNGSDRQIFNPGGYRRWTHREPLAIVTHHWGGNWMKGFDIYSRLDDYVGSQPFSHPIAFTYIGNLPDGFTFRNANYLPPRSGSELADSLRQHHVYVTGSQFEPGSNHQNEGANCGLPLLYRNSGCLPEYCAGFGIEFQTTDFPDRLQEFIDTYDIWVERMPAYPHTSAACCARYVELFETLLDRRAELVRDRSARLSDWERLEWKTQPVRQANRVARKVRRLSSQLARRLPRLTD